jgi:hypothetical protein
VNGVDYVYPTLPGVDWLEVGPDMAPQSYQLPIRDTYIVRFAAMLQDGMLLASVEEHRVTGATDGTKAYALRQVNSRTRSAPITAEVRYSISKNMP